MIHGRGASAQDILTNVPLLNDPDFAYLAPSAPNNVWYPHPYRMPLQDNEPSLSASLSVITEIVSYLTRVGIPTQRVILFGFSQGACLSLEYAARHAQRYGGVVGLSGVLIGPDGLERGDHGSLLGTPVFLGSSDIDPYFPKERVDHAAAWLRHLGGEVTVRIYPNMDHTVNDDEIRFVQGLMATVKTP